MQLSYGTLINLASHGDEAARQAAAEWLKSAQFTIVVYNGAEDSYDILNRVSNTRSRQFLNSRILCASYPKE